MEEGRKERRVIWRKEGKKDVQQTKGKRKE